MSDQKGKGKARNDEDELQPEASDTFMESSMLSRVAASASGLARSAFASPTSNEMNGQINSTTGKVLQPSRSIGEGNTQAEGSGFHQNHSLRASESSGLRSNHNAAHIRQSENEFSQFLDGIDSFQPSESIPGIQPSDEPLEAAWSKGSRGTQPVLHRTVMDQELRDGQEVIAILSDPGTAEEDFDRAREQGEAFDWGLSPEQISQLREITKELFPLQEPHREVSIDNPLNLVPNLNQQTAEELMGNGVHLALDQWREQWQGVLTRYTDEVWGNLLPLVQQARQEILEIGEVPPMTQDSTALRRLQSVLGHLQRK